MRDPAAVQPEWPWWQRVLFRFFFVYLLLQMAPWGWFLAIPGVSFVLNPVYLLIDKSVRAANANIFHVRETLVRPNGSGDTSWAWTQLWLYLSVALVVCVVWSVLDRKRGHYDRLLYWLRLTVRYYLATFALLYGIIKLFALQMPFPNLSQLATPLGDLLPMRFSWLFIGYSFPYQFFAGAMETTAGLLLLYRRTVTAGIFVATGAFANVVMINMSYDVPVKLFAAHLLFASLFMLALDAPRLINLLVLNRATPPTSAYEPNWAMPWQRWAAVAVKVFLVYQILVVQVMNGWTRYQQVNAPPQKGAFATGIYDVRRFVRNKSEVPATLGDTLRWKDVIFDVNSVGSVNVTDTAFSQRYHRGYFRFKADTAAKTMQLTAVTTIPGDNHKLMTMRYEIVDSVTVRLHTQIRGDSIHVDLVRMPRHFQLTERQFHWVSEYNR